MAATGLRSSSPKPPGRGAQSPVRDVASSRRKHLRGRQITPRRGRKDAGLGARVSGVALTPRRELRQMLGHAEPLEGQQPRELQYSQDEGRRGSSQCLRSRAGSRTVNTTDTAISSEGWKQVVGLCKNKGGGVRAWEWPRSTGLRRVLLA